LIANDTESSAREVGAQYEARLAALTCEREEFKARAERAEHERNEFRKLYMLVLLELARLKRELFGQKAETVDPAQVQLAFSPVLEALERARAGEAAAGEVESELEKLRKRAKAEVDRRKAEKIPPKPHGRRDLSLENLPVETITLEPPERLLPGGEALEKIGEEVSEHIDRRPASLVRVRVVRPKYKRREPSATSSAAATDAPAATLGVTQVAPGNRTMPSMPAADAPAATVDAPAQPEKSGAPIEDAPSAAVGHASAEFEKPAMPITPTDDTLPAATIDAPAQPGKPGAPIEDASAAAVSHASPEPEGPAIPIATDDAPPPAIIDVPAQPEKQSILVAPIEDSPSVATVDAPAQPEPTIIIAPLPDRPIPRGIAGPGLLAYVLVSKFADHLPLHRQEKIFRREGLHLPRSTLCGFVQGSVVLLSRVVDAMWEDAKANARWLCIDATGLLVLAKGRCRRHHFWVVVAERDHVLFRHTKTNDGEVPARALRNEQRRRHGRTRGNPLLKGYRGYVHADASSVYHELYRREAAIIEVGCWSHGRRRAFDALSTDEPRALVIIGFISLLFDAHLLATDPKTKVTDGAKRKADAQPVIDRLYAWIAAERPKVADEAPIAKAMNYLVNHRVPLTRFLDNGLLRLDNNLSEIELRREKVGAHNWLYCGSDDFQSRRESSRVQWRPAQGSGVLVAFWSALHARRRCAPEALSRNGRGVLARTRPPSPGTPA
jgi:transposase